MGEGPWPAPRIPSPLRGSERLSRGGLDTPVSGPPSSCPLTGTFRSCCVPVRWGGSTRLPGASSSKGPDRREGRLVPPCPLTCHTAWYNRNVCVPLTLERQSVNVLTCEFAHQIRGSETGRRVPWGEKEGGDEEPDRPGRPTQREQHNKPENNPPTRDTTHGAPSRGTTPTSRRPNLNSRREPQPRPQVENNPTGTQHARQATHQTSPPLQKRTATHKTATNQQPAPPNRGTTRTKNHSPPSRWGRELRRGLRGTDPRTSHHPPTRRRDPPAEHRHPPDRPHLTTNPNQKPDTRTRTPTTLLQPPTGHTPPGTLHTCHGPPAADANACQQTGTNSANKFSQKQTTNAKASTQ